MGVGTCKNLQLEFYRDISRPYCVELFIEFCSSHSHVLSFIERPCKQCKLLLKLSIARVPNKARRLSDLQNFSNNI